LGGLKGNSRRSVQPHKNLANEVARHEDRQEHLTLLLLLILKLYCHQTVIKLGNLPPNQLDFFPWSYTMAAASVKGFHH
jgi:hypothetical protein